MKSFLSFSLAFFFVSICCVAQSPVFSIYGGPSYTLGSAPNSKVNATQFLLINDSTSATIPAIREISYTINNKLGFNLGATVRFPLSEDVSISTGIGLAWTGFDIESNFESLTPIPGGDTTFQSRNLISGNPFPITCDETEPGDSFSDLDPAVNHQLLHLEIPIHVEFAIVKDLMLRAGVQISTPIYSKVSRDVFMLNRREEVDAAGNARTICKNEIERQHDTSGNGLNNLVVGVNVGASYQLSPRFAVDVAFSRNLNTVFATTDVGFVSVFSPTNANLGIYRASISARYFLGKTTRSEKGLDQ